MTFRILPKKEFRRRFGTSKGRISDQGIFLPSGASTKTRLHELGHLRAGDIIAEGETRPMTHSEFVDIEVEAENFVYSRMGKPLTYRSGIAALVELIEDYDTPPYDAVKLVVSSLKRHGILVSREERKILVDYALMSAGK